MMSYELTNVTAAAASGVPFTLTVAPDAKFTPSISTTCERLEVDTGLGLNDVIVGFGLTT